MQPIFDFIAVLLLAGAAQGVLQAMALLTIPRGNRMANRVLALLLILFAASITLHTLAHTRNLFEFPHLIKTAAPLPFLFGTLFYFYVKTLTRREFSFDKKSLWHFLPPVLCATSLIPFYLQSAEDKIQHLLGDFVRPCTSGAVISWLTLIHLLIYIAASANLLRTHADKIKESFSSLEKINLNWLRNLLVVYALDWSALLLWQIYSREIAAANYIWLLASLAICAIGYMGLRQPEIFSGTEEAMAAQEATRKKYEKSTLNPAKAEAYLQKLLHFMADKKPYRNSDLSLHGLARTLSISPHHLSQIINERLRQNFFEFVNSHRVEEAKKMLRDAALANINIAQIGFDAGFSSVSAFNTAFKKYTGMTPSQFRRERGEARFQEIATNT